MYRSLADNIILFRRLNLVFWLIWLLFLVFIVVEIYEIIEPYENRVLLQPEQMACMEILPNLDNFSTYGKIIYWANYAVEKLFFTSMILIIHLAIYRFSKGRIFVHETLASFGILGVLILTRGLSETLLNNLFFYVLYISNDVLSFEWSYVVNIPAMAVGVFILMFKFVLECAVSMQEDVDLTI
jgi:hypothetical protein